MSRRDSRRKVEGSGGGRSPMQGKREGELKERSDESKIKMVKENIWRGNEYVHE